MREQDLRIASDVLVLGAPKDILERYGGRLHRFSGRFSDAVNFTIRELPQELVDYAVIHSADGNWYELAEIQRCYRSLDHGSVSVGRTGGLVTAH
ncbi:hypothetical protein H2509_08015 [Stappia sp. F7233]|uniref:Uncharacterized protein n=1 Tax=Stappia albiluteola TaxID=2758565 RepID=A0A839ADP2_9HYPH|nr:hypothetical protein [Stappia albiluteola]MBA5777074.1 hypothetical protein [Stappia albiluteola]